MAMRRPQPPRSSKTDLVASWSLLNVRLARQLARLSCAAGVIRRETPVGHFVLYLFTAGHGRVSLLDRTIAMSGDTAVLIPPGVNVRVQADRARRVELVRIPFNCVWRNEPIHDARPYVDVESLTLTLPGHVALSLHATLPTANYSLQFLRALARQPADLGELEGIILLLRVLSGFRYSLGHPARHVASMKTPMTSAYRYLMANYSRTDLSLGQLAEHLGMSKAHVVRCFRAEFGITPMQMLQRERMEAARRLLVSPDFHITEVASECGYESIQYFCRVFKAEHGMTPGEFRRQHTLETQEVMPTDPRHRNARPGAR